MTGGVNPNSRDSDGRAALHLAAYVGAAESLDTLLKAKGIQVDIADNSGQTPVFAACDQGRIELVQKLLQAKCKLNLPDLEGKVPLHWMAIAGRLDLVQLLLAQPGADKHTTDARGETVC